MSASDGFMDIYRSLVLCLAAEGEAPESWRPLGEAMLAAPGVRGMAFALWSDAAGATTLPLGDWPGSPEEWVAAARAARWETRAGAGRFAVVSRLAPRVLAAPVGDPEQPRGAVLLAADEPDALHVCALEAAASSLTVALRWDRLQEETQRLQCSAREQAMRMGELAAVSQLAASVAHELRNPLSSIKGAAQYLRNEFGEQETIREFLDIILEEVGVLNRITTEFLNFARPMHLNLEQAHVHDSIRKLLQVMKPQLTAQGIETIVDLGPDVPASAFDRQQMDHVLRNLVLNAVQAMSHGGVLMIRTRLLAVPLPAVEIAVSDTGPGIAPEDLSRLFTPFFTTKAKGVGLGLTIVEKILENHGGGIAVESKPGSGTTFLARLPVAPGAENRRVNR